MTIAATRSRVVYDGTGSVATFPIQLDGTDIVFGSPEEITIFERSAAGAVSQLTQDVHYQIDIDDDTGVFAGTATRIVSGVPTSLPDDAKWAIIRTTPLAQEADLINLGDYSSETIEGALDYLMRVSQDILSTQDLTLKTDQFQLAYEAQSRRITGLANGVAASDAVTMSQLASVVIGDGDVFTAESILFSPVSPLTALNVQDALEEIVSLFGDPLIASISQLAFTTDSYIYGTGPDTAAVGTMTAYARTLLDDANAATARATLGLAIGSNIQAWSASLDSWAAVTRASGFDTFVATPTLANLGSLLTNEAAGLITFMTTPSIANLMALLTDDASGLGTFMTMPSSANLAALLTDETGTGAAVFGTSPTFTTSMLLASGFVFNWNASDLLLTHSANVLTLSGGDLAVPDDAYAVGWNGSANVPTKNAIYDKIETLQPLAANLTSWASVTRASGFDTFTATPSIANLMALLTDDASGLGAFMTTPNSANLRSLLTDETGTGAAVFGTSPTFTTSMLLASGFVFDFAGGDVTITHAANTLAFGGASSGYSFDAVVYPLANDGAALGDGTHGFSDAFFATGGILDWGNNNARITHSASLLTSSVNFAVPDDAYAVGWNGSVNVPTKNAVYDKIELILGTTLPAAYQPLDADLTSWAGVTRASGFDTFTATPSIANLMALLTDDASGLGTFLTTPSIANLMALLTDDASGLGAFLTSPSSANLAALLTDETGSGANVFGTAPTISGLIMTGTADIQQALLLSGAITPAQITGDQNDYAPTGFATAGVLRLSTDASRILTGLAGGAPGRMIIIHNVGTNDIVFANQSSSSSAANRLKFGADITLPASGSILLRYDGAESFWYKVADTVQGAGGGGGAPDDAQYLVAASNGTLSAERVATDTSSVTWDFATGGQAKANVVNYANLATTGKAIAMAMIFG